MKKLTCIFLFLSVALCAPAFAGTQKILPIEISNIVVIDNGPRLKITGQIVETKKSVIAKLSNAAFVGNIDSNLSCEPYQCRTTFSIYNGVLSARIKVDADQDGNPETKISLELGAVATTGELYLNEDFSAELVLVQDRYSFLEKLAGQKDADYFSLRLIKD